MTHGFVEERAIRFCALTQEALRVVNTRASWKLKFHAIFDMIAPEVRATGFCVEWEAPGDDGERDIRSYVAALLIKAEDIDHLISRE